MYTYQKYYTQLLKTNTNGCKDMTYCSRVIIRNCNRVKLDINTTVELRYQNQEILQNVHNLTEIKQLTN